MYRFLVVHKSIYNNINKCKVGKFGHRKRARIRPPQEIVSYNYTLLLSCVDNREILIG